MDRPYNDNKIKIRLTKELETWLYKQSEEQGKSVSQIVREVLYQHINNK